MNPAEHNELSVRTATLDDCQMLLEWRNDPLTRSGSRNSELIDEKSHRKWLSESLANPKRRLLIACVKSEPVGTVRIDFADQCEVSWTVAPSARGKGLGAKMVELVLRDFERPLVAVVRSTNRASLRIAKTVGFVQVKCEGDWLTLHRPADFKRQSNE